MNRHTGQRIEITKSLSPKDLEEYAESSIEVLIPAHNSSRSIGKVIVNLESQILPSNSQLKIVVCANACEDSTVYVARNALNHASKTNKNISSSLIATSKPGEAQALNRMLKEAISEIIIVINDDVEPSQYSLAALYIAMKKNPKLCAIGIPSRPFPNFAGNKQILAVRIANQISQLYLEKDITIVGRMYAFRKSVINHFPNIMSEDNFLTYVSLVRSSGYGIVKDGQSYVYHKPPSTYSDVFSQTFMHSLSGVQFFREYPDAIDMFYSIEESMRIKGKIADEQGIRDVAQKIQNCCWQMAVLVDKLNPVKGSLRERIKSTVS